MLADQIGLNRQFVHFGLGFSALALMLGNQGLGGRQRFAEVLIFLTGRGEGLSDLLFLQLGFFELLERLGERKVGRFQARPERRQFFVGLAELLLDPQRFLCLIFLFLGGLVEPVVVELDGHLKGLNGLSEFGGLAAGQTVDFVLNLGDLVVQFDQGFLGRFMLVQKRLTLSEVLLSLIDVKGQFVLQGRISRLEQHGVGHLYRIGDFLCFLSDVSLFGERGQSLQLFLFEQPDAIEVVLDHVLLFVGFSNFIVVRGDPGHVVKHFASFVGRHLREARHVALKHDVVAVRTGVGRTQQAMEHLLRAFLAVEFVGGHRVV